MADEMTFGAQDTRAGIFAVLVDQFGEAGARHGEWLKATMALYNVSKATFNRHLKGLTDGLTVEKVGEKYYPVRQSETPVRQSETKHETNHETGYEIKEKPDSNEISTQNIKVVRPGETNDKTKVGLKVSPVSPPYGGNGETDPPVGSKNKPTESSSDSLYVPPGEDLPSDPQRMELLKDLLEMTKDE